MPLDCASGTDGHAGRRLTLVKLAFALHSGAIWGLPGRLLIDVVGVALAFLSISAVYIWYFPRAKRWFPQTRASGGNWRETKRRAFQWLWRYHIDIGVWTAAVLMVIAGTALLIPPSPLVSFSARTPVSRQVWPGPLPDHPWHGSIGNAAYDPARKEIVVEASGSLWRGPADMTGVFAKDPSIPPVSGMGVNVMEFTRDGGLVIGSFSGLYECRPNGGPVVDLRTGKPCSPNPTRRSAEGWKVTGYVETPAGERFAVVHDQGLVAIGRAERNGRFTMPVEMARGYRMPLWSFLFEVHNGRILRDWIGSSYYLIPLLGAVGLLLLCLFGLYDWAFRKLSTRRTRSVSVSVPARPSAKCTPTEQRRPVPIETGVGG